jgi:hypothetical protein
MAHRRLSDSHLRDGRTEEGDSVMTRCAGSACALSALLAAVALASILLPGCSRTSPQSQQPEELSFAVSDSLLGPAILIDETDTSLRPPSAFAAVSDSVLQVLRKSGLPSSEEQGAEQLRVEPGAELVAAFLDSARRAGLAVFGRLRGQRRVYQELPRLFPLHDSFPPAVLLRAARRDRARLLRGQVVLSGSGEGVRVLNRHHQTDRERRLRA